MDRGNGLGDTECYDQQIQTELQKINVKAAAFNKFLFGWTVATGAATQIADVRKFRMSFRP